MFYTFEQNNSGGYYEVDEVIAHVVIVEADSWEEANDIAGHKGVFSYDYCSCCGERFDPQHKSKKGYATIKEALKPADWMRADKEVRVHFKDGSVSKEVQS